MCWAIKPAVLGLLSSWKWGSVRCCVYVCVWAAKKRPWVSPIASDTQLSFHDTRFPSPPSPRTRPRWQRGEIAMLWLNWAWETGVFQGIFVERSARRGTHVFRSKLVFRPSVGGATCSCIVYGYVRGVIHDWKWNRRWWKATEGYSMWMSKAWSCIRLTLYLMIVR